MENKIRLHNIETDGKRITYRYAVEGDVKKYFSYQECYSVDYDIVIDKLPKSILTIPFVGMMLGISIIFNVTVEVEELDDTFLKCIPDIVKGYNDIYNGHDLKCKVIAKKSVSNVIDKSAESPAALLYYGGGIDSAYSLVKHNADEKIALLQIWGADVPYENENAWINANAVTKKCAEHFETDSYTIKCPFHLIFKEGILDAYVENNFHENFWHGFQHGVGMLTQGMPVAYKLGIKKCLFAATFSKDMDQKSYTCASDPRIDNYVKFANGTVDHDGFEASRQRKVHVIANYIRKKSGFPIRVCYLSKDGINCCECEKCTRSAFAFYAEKMDPKLVGIDYDEKKLAAKLNNAASEIAGTPTEPLYRDMQKVFQENYIEEEIPKGLLGFYKLPFEEYMMIVGTGQIWHEKYRSLKAWTDQLQLSKDWLEKQYIEQKEWIEELQKAKDWLEEQYRLSMEFKKLKTNM